MKIKWVDCYCCKRTFKHIGYPDFGHIEDMRCPICAPSRWHNFPEKVAAIESLIETPPSTQKSEAEPLAIPSLEIDYR